MAFVSDKQIRFHHCDPAGIVFYPNYFRWMDATFHRLLKDMAGGHSHICRQLGAVGIGLIETELGFRSPASDGDTIGFRILDMEWATRSVTVRYEAVVDQRRVLEGFERRGLFLMHDGKMIAGEIARLSALLRLG